MDINTLIHNYKGLYDSTFGAQNQHDAIFNASYYDEYYVSAHNKIVYTSVYSETSGVQLF